MFDMLGRGIAYHPWRIVAVWALATLAGWLWIRNAEKAPPDEMGSFLPRSAPYSIATEKLGRAFPALTSRSQVAIIACRPEGITEDDIAWLDQVGNRARQTQESHVINGILSPAAVILQPRLVSRNGKAAMAVLNLSTNMISGATATLVNDLERLIADGKPPGLTVELTNSGAIGRDYARATTQALDRTTLVTVVAVLVILVLVYRSPVGAVVPLISIGLSVYLTFVILAGLVKAFHWDVSTMERIFAVVLIFGAGVDYALFWIARYREGLHDDGGVPSYSRAAVEATRHVGHAVLFSALTTMLGMCSLLVAELGPTRGAGKVLVVSLGMALLAGLTLVPAIARLLGRWMFWPVGASASPTFAQRAVWPRLADAVIKAPTGVLALGLVLLAIPAGLSARMQPRFDSLLQLPEGSTSQRGYEIAETHFSRGQIYGTVLLFTFDRRPGSPERMRETSRNLREQILAVQGVEDVYTLDAPLGRNAPVDRIPLLGRLVSDRTEQYYLSQQMPALRFEVLINDPPFSLEAMHVVDQVGAIAHQRVDRFADAGIDAEVHLSGLTPYIMAVRDVVSRDQRRVMVLATLLIALAVLFLVRDVPLTLFMVFATLLTFGATLKLTEFFFVHAMGLYGLDWKVRIIVFVIVVAVGQDYNIFLVSRLMEERRTADSREAVRRSMVHTGTVISSCGIIMAATLGSLWAGGLSLLRQVGFALALGILIDTYFVRPILIPSFFLAIRGRGRKAARVDSGVSVGTRLQEQ